MTSSRIATFVLSIICFILSVLILKENTVTALLVSIYSILFLILTAVNKSNILIKRVSYTIISIGSFGLYIIGIRNDIIIMSLVLGVGSLIASLLQQFRDSQRAES